MFGLFKSSAAAPYADPVLGELVRSRGQWRGTFAVDAGTRVPLALPGTGSTPDPAALALAHRLPAALPGWRPVIAEALFEHYGILVDGAGDDPEDAVRCPAIPAADAVWPHVKPLFIAIAPMSGAMAVEIGYTVAWDDDHTLGARFDATGFVELCGSTVAP